MSETNRGRDVEMPPHAGSAAPDADETLFPIVGIGAAEGGLAPFLEIVHELGARPGLAVVLVLQHGEHVAALDEVIARDARIPVRWIEQGAQPRRDHVYLAPPNTRVTIDGRRFAVQPLQGDAAAPIDAFLTSLADDAGERAVAVILSGSGSDGVRGARAVRGEGGVTLAQDESAELQQLPHAAVTGGAVDTELPPRKIARELLRIARVFMAPRRLPQRELHSVFNILHRVHDLDFTHYKPATVERRIRRRMAVHGLTELAQYAALLRGQPEEVTQLYNEILIRVTSFFRDTDVYEALRTTILPEILRGRDNDDPVRIWVPGCATGEEVYSLAMLFVETAAELGVNCPFQIFGTDVSDRALERARLGVYGDGIVEEVSAERLRRFFVRIDGAYRIVKAVRDVCVFARQNVAKDPPFSGLDLISCRNVLIYLGSVLQRKVMSLFHYGLRNDGYLLLGSSESIGNYGELFATVDRKYKIYQKKPGATRMSVDFTPAPPPHREPVERIRMHEETPPTPTNVFREADRIMLSRYSPPGVVVDENLEIVQFRGRTSPFLEPAAGAASFNVLKMAREGLLTDLRSALEESRKRDTPVRRENVRVRNDGDDVLVNLEVVPFLTPGKARYQIILFDAPPAGEPPARARKRKKAATADEAGQAAQLTRELEGTREYLQSIIEAQEAMNEELRAANEEIHSSNEELQSTNEELETAKEELQSSNEELTTLNEELENRNEELAQANNDLTNLLASIDLPIVILDSQLRIRRFNPGSRRTFNLIAGDVGRPLRDLKTMLHMDTLDRLVGDVIETLETRELEVTDREGTTYLLRIRPYKTSDNRIDGAVLVLIDIDQFRKLKP